MWDGTEARRRAFVYVGAAMRCVHGLGGAIKLRGESLREASGPSHLRPVKRTRSGVCPRSSAPDARGAFGRAFVIDDRGAISEHGAGQRLLCRRTYFRCQMWSPSKPVDMTVTMRRSFSRLDGDVRYPHHARGRAGQSRPRLAENIACAEGVSKPAGERCLIADTQGWGGRRCAHDDFDRLGGPCKRARRSRWGKAA